MSELHIDRIERKDIQPPSLEAGSTTVILQRHEAYERNTQAHNAGSITDKAAYDTDLSFFARMLDQETEGGPQLMALMVSSDTQYAGKGYRSVETTDLALQATMAAMSERGIDPTERIINLHPGFHAGRLAATDSKARPMPRLREPQLFGENETAYLQHLLEKYGDIDNRTLSVAAWAAHEADAEKETRQKTGTEGVTDIVGRTKQTLRFFERYGGIFHSAHPNKHLVIWAGTHYDTISPLVKDATGTPFGQYIPVAYGGGVVIELPSAGNEATLHAGRRTAVLKLGRHAATEPRRNPM